MPTLTSELFDGDVLDKLATEPIIQSLTEKYNRNFSISALGDRFGGNTATAYVFADNDPTMLFVVKVSTKGEVVYENYSHRLICRKIENVIKAIFEKYDFQIECFIEFDNTDNEIPVDITVDQFLHEICPDFILLSSIIIRASEKLTEDCITRIYKDISSRLSGVTHASTLYVLEPDDYGAVEHRIRTETQLFDAYRLKRYGTKSPIQQINVRATHEELSVSMLTTTT